MLTFKKKWQIVILRFFQQNIFAIFQKKSIFQFMRNNVLERRIDGNFPLLSIVLRMPHNWDLFMSLFYLQVTYDTHFRWCCRRNTASNVVSVICYSSFWIFDDTPRGSKKDVLRQDPYASFAQCYFNCWHRKPPYTAENLNNFEPVWCHACHILRSRSNEVI